MKWHTNAIIVLSGIFYGCGYSSGGSSTTPAATSTDTTVVEAKFSSIQSKIFAKSCAMAGCHVQNAQFPALEKELAFGDLVGVPSRRAQGQTLVVRSDAASSYLVRKLLGTQTDVGGSGSQMPRGGTPLSQSDIDAIKKWINDGAKND